MFHLESLMHPEYGCAPDCHFVAAGIRPAVEGGILPPGPALEAFGIVTRRAGMPPGETPGFMRLKPVEPSSPQQQQRHLTARNLPGGIETHQPVCWLGGKVCLSPQTHYGWCKRYTLFVAASGRVTMASLVVRVGTITRFVQGTVGGNPPSAA